MSEKSKKRHSKERSEKKRRKHQDAEHRENGAVEKSDSAVKSSISLLADETRIDPTLSSLFAAKPTPVVRKPQVSRQAPAVAQSDEDEVTAAVETDDLTPVRDDDESDGQVSSEIQKDSGLKRKRRRKADEDEIEDAYMRRLAREEAKEAEVAAAERASKRQKTLPVVNGHAEDRENGRPDQDAIDDEEEQDEAVDETMSPPPRHETEQTPDIELAKANRTIFLGNVSTKAISSKSSRKVLIDHLKSFFISVPSSKAKEKTKHKIESIRFRSTPYATAVPKKASFAKGEVMDATTKSTNAYVVYSSPAPAREAVKHLNGAVVLDRHLRVDSVAHPSPIDHRRCVFVGGLSFVDDESNIQNATEDDDGKQKRKKPKQPADVEEGLWRTFAKCGNVESVRVIRDSTTRVGKGIAYVQFEDGNAVEAALLYDGKKFPPMLPRTLRVSRAKAVKRNQKTGSKRSGVATNGGKRKVVNGDASQLGRAKKLFGHAAAMSARREMGGGEKRSRDSRRAEGLDGVKRPEHFVFEGHRASSKGGKSGLKLGKKKGGKPTNRSARRGAAFKAGKKK